ncbi:MAG: response regulator [Nitrospirae bacterium]|nr:response regulator [Nitrospirota bacterium]MBF0535750.1 response regulator [Nitrospirota bacterium]MBF0615779.1 response regulator [Nitrospirota bacterium]
MGRVLYSREQAKELVLVEKKVLVIEDFKEFRDYLRRSLLGLGAKLVETTEDGAEAVNKVSHKHYDIILCDYNLGDGKKDGQQVFEELKYNNKVGFSTIFIMITAENTINMVMSMMDFHPDGYLIKPFTSASLVQRIKAVDEKKKMFADIDEAISRRDYSRALVLCDKLMEKYPKQLLDILKVKGEVNMLKPDYTEAEKVYLQVLNMYRVLWAVYNLGKVYYFTERFIEARDTFKGLIIENDLFIPAYDWLAKSLERLGDTRGAQGTLEEAVHQSPKAILRQRALGNIAFKNKDLNKAETSLRTAVKLGKTSLFKDASDYTQLAKVLVKKSNAGKALDMVSEVRADFPGNDEVLLQAILIEGHIYSESEQQEKAVESLKQAEEIYTKLDGRVSPDVAIEIAQSFIAAGEKDKGMEMMKSVVRNNHSDDGVLSQVQETFKDLGMGEEGLAFVADTKAEIISINNKGVDLINKGMFIEAIDLFEKAADGMTSNFVINLNALRATLGYMQKKGRDDKYLFKCEKFITRINGIDPENMKFQQLQDIYNTLLHKKES